MRPAAARAQLERLRSARLKVAVLMQDEPAYAPIFARLENEIRDMEAMQSGDVIERARAIARQMAIA